MKVYDYIYHDGYLVYRHCFNETKCSLIDGALEHKEAVFVCETHAKYFCKVMNEYIEETGSDNLEWIMYE